jgi:hypothetical protein
MMFSYYSFITELGTKMDMRDPTYSCMIEISLFSYPTLVYY